MRIDRKGCRGLGLASVLIAALILSVLLTVLIGANMSTLSVVRHSEGAAIARSASESLLARAVRDLRSDAKFGLAGESLNFAPKWGTSGVAKLTFDPDQAADWDVPVSINNLDNAESVPGHDGTPVPARTARLFALGNFGKEQRTVRLDLHIPPYPYAIATAGTFESLGDLSLTGRSPDTGESVPGHLMTNGGSDSSLQLGPRTDISGDLTSVGGIQVANDLELGGELRPYSAAKEIPKITLSDYDPRLMPEGGATTPLDSSFFKDPALEGKVARDGDLMLSGDIKLDGALLYVDGDLEISGTISGRGAIVATGKVVIQGTQSLTTDNELALLVGDNLSILGDGVDSSKIEGLIYSEGDVEVRNSTIQGSLISQSNGGTLPTVVMERANFIYDPEAATFSSSVETTTVGPALYLAYGTDGLISTESSVPVDPDSECSTPPTDPAFLFVGVAKTAEGFLFFPPDGSEPVESGPGFGAMLAIAKIVLEHMPELLGSNGNLNLGGLGTSVSDFTALLDSLEEAPTTGSETTTTMNTSQFDLEIDPMKFLKYGEEMRIRSMRCVETCYQGAPF